MKQNLFWVMVLMGCLVIGPGCGKKTAQPAEAMIPVQGLVDSLCQDANPYIKNNAKHGAESWKAKDYQAAVLAFQKVGGLCRTPAQVEATMAVMKQLNQEVQAAAKKGDKSAIQALEYLK